MSNISNTHSIINYTSGVTKPLSGQQLISVHFKVVKESTKDNPLNVPVGTKPASKAVSLPIISDADLVASADKLLPALRGLVIETRESILRDAVINGKTELPEDSINLDAIIAKLVAETSSNGNRISKDSLNTWFDEVAMTPLMLAISNKLGVTDVNNIPADKLKLISDTLDSYKINFAKLSAPKAILSDTVIAALEKAISIIGAEVGADDKVSFITGKLKQIKEKPVADLMAL